MSLKDEEYLNLLKKDNTVVQNVETIANLNTIIHILIDKNLITEKEYSELYEKSKENTYKIILESLTQEQKDNLETNKIFDDLFGRFLRCE